jgi:hypothetical protein
VADIATPQPKQSGHTMASALFTLAEIEAAMPSYNALQTSPTQSSETSEKSALHAIFLLGFSNPL